MVEIATSIFDVLLTGFFGIPGLNALQTSIRILVENRIRDAQLILVEELSKGNLKILEAEETKEFIPIAFRFFSAARDGETRRILRVIARILRGQIDANDLDSEKFSRCTHQLAGLSQRELILLVEFSKVGVPIRVKGDSTGLKRASTKAHLQKKLIPSVFVGPSQFEAACGLLVGRGLLTVQILPNMDDLTIDYWQTGELERLVKLAKLEELNEVIEKDGK